MITEVLAGAALIKSSVSAIKSAIGTANDVTEIAGFIDQVFLGQQQVKKSQEEGNSLNSVAKDMIDAELAREATQQLKLLVNMRFGSGTWERIETERGRRVKDADRRAKAQAAKRQEQVRSGLPEPRDIVVMSRSKTSAIFIIKRNVWLSFHKCYPNTITIK